MQIQASRLTLQLENPFKLSYGATTFRENVRVTISDGVYTGTGEAAVVPYYGETPDRVLAYLTDPALADALGDDPLLLDDMLNCLPSSRRPLRAPPLIWLCMTCGGSISASRSIACGELNPARIPMSSFTVAMADDESDYRAHLRAARMYGLIKLKLGSGDWRTDWHMVEIARQEISASLCVDANGGWTVEDTRSIIPRLAEIGVLFIEQPVARDDWEGWRALPSVLPAHHPPLIADESVQGVESVLPLAGIADGINIKLAKCGGLRAARQMILLARALGLKVLIGCMIESSIAVTAAAHLAPLADFVDLDGNVLITNDPFCGVHNSGGQITLPHAPGLGVTPRAE